MAINVDIIFVRSHFSQSHRRHLPRYSTNSPTLGIRNCLETSVSAVYQFMHNLLISNKFETYLWSNFCYLSGRGHRPATQIRGPVHCPLGNRTTGPVRPCYLFIYKTVSHAPSVIFSLFFGDVKVIIITAENRRAARPARRKLRRPLLVVDLFPIQLLSLSDVRSIFAGRAINIKQAADNSP